MKKIIKTFSKNYGKFRELTLSIIAGILAGTMVGIFFNLTTDITFNRWINIFNFEVFAGIIFLSLSVFALWILYLIGYRLIKNNFGKKSAFRFYLNYIAGMYGSSTAFLVVFYSGEPPIRNTIAATFVIMYLILAYFTIKKKHPK